LAQAYLATRHDVAGVALVLPWTCLNLSLVSMPLLPVAPS